VRVCEARARLERAKFGFPCSNFRFPRHVIQGMFQLGLLHNPAWPRSRLKGIESRI
jgi:hypothetical protein